MGPLLPEAQGGCIVCVTNHPGFGQEAMPLGDQLFEFLGEVDRVTAFSPWQGPGNAIDQSQPH